MLIPSHHNPFWQQSPNAYLFSLAGVAGTTAVLWVFHAGSNLPNVFMVYILVVIVMAVQIGRLPAVLAAFTSLLSIDFFFVQPIFRFTIADPTEWFALLVFLIVAIITSELTARLRREVHNTQQHDAEMTVLAETSWQVASEYDNVVALSRTLKNMASVLELDALAVILIQDDESLSIHCAFGMTAEQSEKLLQEPVLSTINFVRTKGLPVGPYAPNFPNSHSALLAYETTTPLEQTASTFLPIHIDANVSGIVFLRSPSPTAPNQRETKMLQALLNHVVLILQREKSFAAEARAQALLEANKLKSALLAMVSHDFRSPLTSIKASIQTLTSPGLEFSPDESKALLEAIENETERINRMVTNILDLSRLEAGAWKTKYESLPMSELLGSVLGFFSEQENSRIVTKNLVDSESVFVDVVQIEQVLKNLLENALKYSPSGKLIDLTSRLEGETLVIEVSDRGFGLMNGEEERVFEPFYRGKHLSESNVPGVGIGLSICKGLVEAHGGMIEAFKRDGGGSIFRVTLPNRQSAALPKLSIV